MNKILKKYIIIIINSLNFLGGGFVSIKKLERDFSDEFYWEAYSKNLEVELEQCLDEGLDISEFESDFEKVFNMPFSKEREDLADKIFEKILNSNLKSDYKYNEPSDLYEIKALRKPYNYKKEPFNKEMLYEKIKGAWYGRICGCLLGKGLEGIKLDELIPFLKETNNYPLTRYPLASEISEEMIERYKYNLGNKWWADVITTAPVDDDTTYVVLAQILIDEYGFDFTPRDVARLWLKSQPIEKYFTAERIAFINFINGYAPPYSAVYKNPFREWIGAQIRGDYFGYINPGNKELAAEFAFRDASISHVKNGIYGEMFVAAMLSCAAESKNIIDVIKAGLSEIPATSRLYEAVLDIISRYENGESLSEVTEFVNSIYDDKKSHHAVHTISNALIVVIALLYGEGDFGKSICIAVQMGFDTDCNGATVGSVLGMLNGFNSIGDEWVGCLNNKLDTGITGMGIVEISSLVEKTIKHINLKGV